MTTGLMRRRDDYGSLAMAVLFTIVGVSVCILLTPMIVTQIGSTRHEIQRAHALHAAMAGLEVGVGAIRAAVSSDGRTGTLTDLPACDTTLTGDTGTGAGRARYRLTVHYLDVDPRGQSEQWARDHAVCATGTPASTPAYALLVSTGIDGLRRTLHGTYTFRTTNATPPGGLIKAMKRSPFALDLCIDAGAPPWSAGRDLTMQRCVVGSARQAFAYERELSLVLTGSRTAALPLGLCIDGGSPHAAGNPIRLQECEATVPPRHQWSYNGSANFEGTSNGDTLDGHCLNIQTPEFRGSRMVLGHKGDGNCGDPYSNRQTFAPSAKVGAGSANPPNTTNQLVNFEQFGRCLDVPSGRNSLGYLIAWPCKQSPNGGYLGWNQEWSLPALTMNAATCGSARVPCGKGTISVVAPTGKATPAGTYCMRSPGSTGQHPDILDTCPAGTPPANLTWTVYGDTDDPLARYHIVDYRGNCFAPSLTDLFTSGDKVGLLVMAPCAESTLQMWNAPAYAMETSALKDISEY